MQIVQLSKNKAPQILKEAKNALKQGKVLVCPTDTVYGLVADGANTKAVRKIFQIKKRKTKKPLSVFVKNIAQAKHYAVISKKQEQFLRRVWPGKIIVVLKGKGKLSEELEVGGTIGMRMPDHWFLQKLLGTYPHPLAQTSVNLAGSPPLKDPKEIVQVFKTRKHRPDLLIDEGVLKNSPSRVIDMTGETHKLLRQ